MFLLALDEYGFPRVHNFNLPQIRFDDLESRLAAIPARIAAAHAHEEVIPADDGLALETVVPSRPLSILEGHEAHQRQQTLLMMGHESFLTSPDHVEEKEDLPAVDETPSALEHPDVMEVAEMPEDGTCIPNYRIIATLIEHARHQLGREFRR